MPAKSPPIFDGHNDTLTTLYESVDRGFFDDSSLGHVDLPRAQRGGLAAGFFAIFTPAAKESPERDPMYGLTFTDDGYDVTERHAIDPRYARDYTDALIAYARTIETESAGRVRIVETVDQLRDCLAGRALGMVLHLEGAEAVDTDLGNLEHYYAQGIRSIGLVWSRPNAFARGVPFRFPASPDTGPGLNPAGFALVEACNALGIVVDLSHLNEQGFFDVAATSAAPLVVSHADVYAICPSTRNLTDRQIDAVGASGGLIGINFETLNTHPNASIDASVPLTQITRHIDYITRRIGVDHVAFGSDFDGALMPDDLGDVSRLPNLIQTLHDGGYSEEAIEKIAYRNWLRVIEATWKH